MREVEFQNGMDNQNDVKRCYLMKNYKLIL